MLEQYLGADPFREGIRHYLKSHAYGNTETTDLWDAIEEVTGEPVRAIMDTWIFQGGYPLVTVDLVNDGSVLRLGQERFGYAGDLGEGDAAAISALDHQRWQVPAIFSQSADDVVTFEKVLHRRRLDRGRPDRGGRLGAGQHRGHRLLPGGLRPRPAGRARGQGPDRPLPDRALRPGRRRVGRRAGRPHDRGRLPRPARRLRRRDRPVGVAAHRRRARLPRPPGRRRRPHRAAAPHRAPCCGRRSTASASSRRPTRATATASCAACWSTPSAPWATTTPSRPAPATCWPRSSGGAADGGVRSIRACWPPSISVVASAGDAADFDAFHERFAKAATPQEELRYLYALADFRQPELIDRLLAMSVTDEVRTQNAPYLLAAGHGQPRAGPPGRGSSSATTGTPSTSASRATASCACSRASARCREPDGRPGRLRVLRGARGASGRQAARPAPRAARGQRGPPGPRRRGPQPPPHPLILEWPAAPDRRDPTLFAVDIDSIQLTWSRLDPDLSRVRVGDVLGRPRPGRGRRPRVAPRGPASLVVDGLPARHAARRRGFETPAGRRPRPSGGPHPEPATRSRAVPLRHHQRPAHRRASTSATSAPSWSAPLRPEPYSLRAAQAAIDEIRAWGAELLVVKGDITVDARAEDWAALRSPGRRRRRCPSWPPPATTTG